MCNAINFTLYGKIRIYLLGTDIEREKATVFGKAEFTFWSEETFTWICQHVSGGARHISSRFSSKVR